MRWLVDVLYILAAVLTSPIWLFRMIRTGKIRTDWAGRFGRTDAVLPKRGPRVLFHAVSVGEVNAIRALVDHLLKQGEGQMPLDVVVATTTDTGFARASTLWNGRCAVVRYPFDFSLAVRRFLRSVQPDVVALVELEVWPNFTAECTRSGIPVLVINGRLTERSFRRYRKLAVLIRPMFRRLAQVAVQSREYAKRFEQLGIPRERIIVTGTMKWDTAMISDSVDGAEQFAREMRINRSLPLIVAGSTAPDEHELLLRAVPQEAQLLCAPRKPEWFNDAANVLHGCVRRSVVKSNPAATANGARYFLLDTIGELRMAYALADLVVVGRSFTHLHGSDMMEPVALGKATVVGPAVADFQETVDALLAGQGLIQTTAEHLPQIIAELLNDPQRRSQLARNGRDVIRQNQGATIKTAGLIRCMIQKSTAPVD